jgi:hypothetical protein
MRIMLLIAGILVCMQLLAAGFHDPMQPPPYALNKFRLEKLKNQPVRNTSVTAQKKQEPWVLKSILYSSTRQHAIINNKLVRKGDRIAGAKLVSLKPDSVRLVARGKVIVLKLPAFDQSIKKSLKEKKL